MSCLILFPHHRFLGWVVVLGQLPIVGQNLDQGLDLDFQVCFLVLSQF